MNLTWRVREKYHVPIEGVFIRYYRDKKNRPIGCVAGVYGEGKIGVGYSLYHESAERKAGKPVDKKLGRDIAIGRAIKEWKLGIPKYDYPETLLGLTQVITVKCLEEARSDEEIKMLTYSEWRQFSAGVV